MSKTTQTQKVGASNDTDTPIATIELSGNISKIERFRGYLKIYPLNGGWIFRIPPSKTLVKPFDKNQAKILGKIYKEIEKEKLGKVLKENWEILKKYGIQKEATIINQFKGKRKLENMTKKELLSILKELVKEEE